METKESVADWNRNRVQPRTMKNPLTKAAQSLLMALDEHLDWNSHCGLEASKIGAPVISNAIEELRAVLGKTPYD